jgi:hypothetical protein
LISTTFNFFAGSGQNAGQVIKQGNFKAINIGYIVLLINHIIHDDVIKAENGVVYFKGAMNVSLVLNTVFFSRFSLD